MKFTALFLIIFSSHLFAQDMPKEENDQFEMIPATLTKIIFDTRVGGARPRPGTPRPTPAFYMTFNVKAQDCVGQKHYKVKVVDLYNEYGIILLKRKVDLEGCLSGPTSWADTLKGKFFIFTVEGLSKDRPIKVLNPAFIQTAPPRP